MRSLHVCVWVSLGGLLAVTACGGPLKPRGFGDTAGAAGSEAGAAGEGGAFTSLSARYAFGGNGGAFVAGVITGYGGSGGSGGGGFTGGAGATIAPSTGGSTAAATAGGGSGGTVSAGGGGGTATAAGGGSTETGGTAACQSQLGAGPCSLVADCGCAAGERCGVNAEGNATVCEPEGSIGQYEPGCSSSSDCRRGLGCLFHATATTGVCFPYCESSEDCPNPQGGCVDLGAPALGYCMPNCDPRFAQNTAPPHMPCGSGAGCALDGENGTTYCTAETTPEHEQGAFCQDSGDCAAGHTCQHRTCARYCLVGGSDCDEFPRTSCSELVVLSSGEPFGYCAGGSYFATDVPFDIPELSSFGSVITVPDDSPVSRVMVRVSIAHRYCSDLQLSLMGPDSTPVLLSSGNGGSVADCYFGTYFDDEAPLDISTQSPPFRDAYRPQEPLSALAGQSSQGDWTLLVSDTVSGDVGQLTSFRLTLW